MSAPSLARISGTPSDGDPKTTSGRREDFHRRVRSVRTSRTTIPLREVEIVKSCLLLPMSLSSVRLIRLRVRHEFHLLEPLLCWDGWACAMGAIFPKIEDRDLA